jgi:hypothetical protein
MTKIRSDSIPRIWETSLYRSLYAADVARGASHISSTLKPETLTAAVIEVMSGFIAMHGRLMLDVFRPLLIEALEKRNRADAATMVRDHGKRESQLVPGAARKSGRRTA